MRRGAFLFMGLLVVLQLLLLQPATAAEAKKAAKGEEDPKRRLSVIADTKENRLKHARRVLKASPVEETLEGVIEEAVRIKGPAAAQDMREGIARADTTELTKAMVRAYSTTFTAEELAFLADVSFSEIGKRVQKKMAQYVAKVHPVIQEFAKTVFEDVNARNAEAGAKAEAAGKHANKKAGQRRTAEEVLKSAGTVHSEL